MRYASGYSATDSGTDAANDQRACGHPAAASGNCATADRCQ
jgi:hypothetical protein